MPYPERLVYDTSMMITAYAVQGNQSACNHASRHNGGAVFLLGIRARAHARTWRPNMPFYKKNIALVALLSAVFLAALTEPAPALPAPAADPVAQAAVAEAWLKQAHPAAEPAAVRVTVRSLPFTGASFWTAKAVDRSSGKAMAEAFDDQGQLLADRGEKLIAAEWAAKWSARGGIRDVLWDKLAAMGPSDTLPVTIWLRTDEVQVNKELLVNDVFAAANDMYLRAVAHAKAKGSFVAEFRAKSARQLDDQPGAPMMTADLTKAEILAIAKARSVGWIDYRETPVAQSSTSWIDALLASTGSSGKSGSGEAVCVIEQNLPNDESTLSIRTKYYSAGATDTHSRLVTGIVRSSSSQVGTAPSAYVDVANMHNTPLSGAMNFCGGGVVLDYIWNYSYNCNDSTCTGLVDYWTMIGPYPTITIPSGNSSNPPTRSTVLGSAYNALVVGGSHDSETASRSDDTILSASADYNLSTASDWELPNVVAPANTVVADGYDYSPSTLGTSYSAPMVAGVAAQVHQTNTNLRPWPEAARAILMCSANRDVDSGRLSLTDQVDDRDGAGEVNATLAVQLASSANKVDTGNTPAARGIDYRFFSSAYVSEGNFYSGKYYMRTAESGKRARVVFTWDAHASCTDWTSSSNLTPPSCGAQNLDADLDIYVYNDSTNGLVAYSNTGTSNWEFVEFGAAADTTYRIEIYAFDWVNSSTYYGLAWNFDDYPAN